MKKQALTLVGVLSLLLAAGSAFAQTVHVRANIPFDFIVGKDALPSGQYEVSTLTTGTQTLLISDSRGEGKLMIGANAVESLNPSSKTKLVFQRYGDRYFLSQIWVAGNNRGRELRRSPREAEMALDYKPQQVVVMAELR